jgi:hypothetical protein
MSNLAKQRRPFTDEAQIYYAGLSMFELKSQALSRARQEPKLVARVTLEPGHGFHVAKTYLEGHYTVWGDSDQLLELARVEDDDDYSPGEDG